VSTSVPVKPLVVPGPIARKMLSIGNTKFWELVKAGKIEMANIGGRRMPTVESIERLAKAVDVTHTPGCVIP